MLAAEIPDGIWPTPKIACLNLKAVLLETTPVCDIPEGEFISRKLSFDRAEH